jgi:tetratricopeptide (TPR) repeat protein
MVRLRTHWFKKTGRKCFYRKHLKMMTEQFKSVQADVTALADDGGNRQEPARRMEPPAGWWLRPGVLVTAGMLLIAAVYARTITFEFVSDDQSIPGSPWFRSWSAIPQIFSHDLFGWIGGFRSPYYRPMSALWTLTVKQLTGGSPGWFHLSGIVLHLCLFYLAFVLGRRLFRDDLLAAFAALCYALHPGKVESVAWVGSSGCDGLGAVLFFATLILYMEWQERRRVLAYLTSLICFAATMFTKETLGIAIALIAVHYWLHSAAPQRLWKTILIAVPYTGIAAGYLLARRKVLGAPSPTAIHPALSLAAVWNAPAACWWYVRHLLLPVNRGFMYDVNPISGPGWRTFILPLLGILALLAIGSWILLRRRSANVIFLYAWFVLALAPYIAFSPMVQLHDRYLHLASYPFCALVAYLILRMGKAGTAMPVRFTIAVLVIGLWAAGTWHESSYWRNGLSLWLRAIQTAPRAVEPRMRAAALYNRDSEGAKSLQILDDGLALNPKSPGLWRARGLLLLDLRQSPAARSSFLKVIEVSSLYDFHKFPDVQEDKAWAAFHLGLLDLEARNYTSAEQWLRTAVELLPDAPRFHQALASALKGEGRLDEAREQDALALELNRIATSQP